MAALHRRARYLWESLLLIGVTVVTAAPYSAGAGDAIDESSAAGDLSCALWRVDDGTPEGHSRHLGCTGLYSNFKRRTISTEVNEFTPGYALWSDGAAKTRWIYLPPGTQIDTGGPGASGDMDGWVFPVGTKVWKQFALGSRLIETRFLWKRPSGWFRAVYVWSADRSVALEYTGAAGLPTVGDGPGEPYEIPPSNACLQCHGGARDMLLGFEAVSLAADGARGLTLDGLVAAGLLTASPSETPLVPGGDIAKQALGWLHANCGTACHNQRGAARWTGLHMRLDTGDLASVEVTDTWRTAVGVASSYQPPTGASECDPSSAVCPPWKRIEPGDANQSTVVFRAAVRDPYPGPYPNQMPPIVSHRVPVEPVEALARWIASLDADLR